MSTRWLTAYLGIGILYTIFLFLPIWISCYFIASQCDVSGDIGPLLAVMSGAAVASGLIFFATAVVVWKATKKRSLTLRKFVRGFFIFIVGVLVPLVFSIATQQMGGFLAPDGLWIGTLVAAIASALMSLFVGTGVEGAGRN